MQTTALLTKQSSSGSQVTVVPGARKQVSLPVLNNAPVPTNRWSEFSSTRRVSKSEQPTLADPALVDQVRAAYARMNTRIEAAKSEWKRPLTLAEKILVSHAHDFEHQEWKRGEVDLLLRPDRVAMQDATAQMALLQFMQSGKKQTVVPATIHCDHLIRAESGAKPDVERALDENKEVYDFLRSAAGKYGVGLWQPNSGIIHQVVLENYAFPGGLMIGSDSHTPNAGGLGMMAIGVGGADVGEVMAGLPWQVAQPKLIGVKLTGRLQGWAAPKDVITHLLGMLTVKGGTNKIVEYFGSGCESISATGKATICNMGAELGATTSIFPYDKRTADYLRATNRGEIAALADENKKHLKADPEVLKRPQDFYDEIIEIDLSELTPEVVGPHSPDRARKIGELGADFKANEWPLAIQAALIGSCTNSSYEDMKRAADIATQGLKAGLMPKTKFLIAPGSERIRRTMEEEGLTKTFEELGATVFANACGPCIGQWNRSMCGTCSDQSNKVEMKAEQWNTIVSSFNRNFPGRNDGNPNTLSFITSPEMVTALAFAGTMDFDPTRDSLPGPDGKPFFFTPPERQDLPKHGFAKGLDGYQAPAKDPDATTVQIPKDSERLAALAPFPKWDGRDFEQLPVLVKAQGKTTTDQISPAGPWLRYRGHLDKISDNMLLGAKNALTGETGKGTNAFSGETGVQLSAIARDYAARGSGWLIVGDENYGEGSSREHAAMSPRHLGCKAVLARSFARIHEQNLKKQGILPLRFTDPKAYEQIEANDTVSIVNLARLEPGKTVEVRIHKPNGDVVVTSASHSMSEEHLSWFRAGSALNALS